MGAPINSSDKDYVQRSTREKLTIIMANLKALARVKGGEQLVRTAKSFFIQKESFTPNQITFIDTILEKTYKGAGFDSCSTKYDFNKPKLRF